MNTKVDSIGGGGIPRVVESFELGPFPPWVELNLTLVRGQFFLRSREPLLARVAFDLNISPIHLASMLHEGSHLP